MTEEQFEFDPTAMAARAVKFVDGSDNIIEGLAMPFGGPFAGKDLHGEDFGPDTDFVLELFPEGRPILYDHGLNKGTKVTVQGRQTDFEARDEGIWARGELDRSAKYHATVKKMLEQGKLFFSSGAIPHLAKSTSTGHITRWPVMELSLTPTPAHPGAHAGYAVKSVELFEHLDDAGIEVPVAIKTFLEREDGSESESFAAQADRIAVALDAFAGRAELRREWRAKANRTLSTANRAELAAVVDSLRPVGEAYQRLNDLLARTDPAALEAGKIAEQEFLRFQRQLAEQNGVPVGNA